MSTSYRAVLPILLAAALVAPVAADETSPAKGETGQSFDQASTTAQEDLERSLKELAALRESIAREKLPLTRKLNEAESRLVEARRTLESVSRDLDSRNLELSNLRNDIKARHDERDYLANLIGEYVRNFETRVHISELQRYRDELHEAHLASENTNLAPAEVYRTQTAVVAASLDRLLDAMGGTTFEGKGVDESGIVQDVKFALIGPVALYSSRNGTSAGLAEQRLGSLEPNLVPLGEPDLVTDARALVQTGSGLAPFDPSLGNAQKVDATQETWIQHIVSGGPVMVPILLMAFAALVVAAIKWLQLLSVRKPPAKKVGALLDALKRRDHAAAAKQADAIPGPTGEMLRAGLERLGEPKELVEEVMFEKMLGTRLRLQSFLPFIAMTASAAPLLGLLGTVTGMINTFKLITVFGTGDAKTLSSGISEALVTTEFGLIVAIPALLLYAYLSRKARRQIDGMEKTAVSFLNRIAPTSPEPVAVGGEPSSGLTPEPGYASQ